MLIFQEEIFLSLIMFLKKPNDSLSYIMNLSYS